eukprot:COSAG05_NODE_895_length_6700_cov_14.354189_4_plen_57_part_00
MFVLDRRSAAAKSMACVVIAINLIALIPALQLIFAKLREWQSQGLGRNRLNVVKYR